METALFTISSSLHKEAEAPALLEPFIRDIENALGQKFIWCGSDFSTFGTHDRDLIYVRTGGTEGIFRSLGLEGEIRLLTSGKSNSLAASMEILSYIRSKGGKGEILHGTAEYIASRILSGGSECSVDAAASEWIRPLPELDFGGVRLGIVGKPSDWLISSDVDYFEAARKLGVELVDISVQELIDDVRARGVDMASFAGSEAVYEALKGITAKYSLSGLTLRCFDLLDTVHNTGCLALARLNAEGIPSSCEGDIPALLTMMMAAKLTGCPGFQCNLSRVSGDELLFAHCTVPLSMVDSFTYNTHFESGIGTAIKGELPVGEVTVCKISPALDRMVCIPARLLRNQSECNLCRTQVVLSAPGASQYFLRMPFANHHVIVPGKLF